MPSKKRRRRYILVAAARRKCKIPKSTFYDLIKSGKVQARCFTERKTKVCEGYYDDKGVFTPCLTAQRSKPIDCRSCTIPPLVAEEVSPDTT